MATVVSAMLACLGLWAFFLPAGAAQAGPPEAPVAIDLTVQVGKNAKTVHAEPPAQGLLRERKRPTRLVVQAPAGERITIRWSVKRGKGEAALKGILLHLFVVPEEKAGQAAIPKLDQRVAVESAVALDLGAGVQGKGDVEFVPGRPGPYLVRLETIGAANVDGREHFAALDLVIASRRTP